MEQNDEMTAMFEMIQKKSIISDEDQQRLLETFKRINVNNIWSTVENVDDFHAEQVEMLTIFVCVN
ncbi:hypothetical protein BLA29_009865 [Euroglyphus maynei]|uniref:Uncharacterized protein n=1 Tax=Euroglyphus maynei TaxID=6958 RepID=A0A1Y3AM13_EURMA|nr:hypothetical protein BLA29_009865 [Euroglyphus maynei]